MSLPMPQNETAEQELLPLSLNCDLLHTATAVVVVVVTTVVVEAGVTAVAGFVRGGKVVVVVVVEGVLVVVVVVVVVVGRATHELVSALHSQVEVGQDSTVVKAGQPVPHVRTGLHQNSRRILLPVDTEVVTEATRIVSKAVWKASGEKTCTCAGRANVIDGVLRNAALSAKTACVRLVTVLRARHTVGVRRATKGGCGGGDSGRRGSCQSS